MENKKKKGFLDEFFIKNSMDLPFFLNWYCANSTYFSTDIECRFINITDWSNGREGEVNISPIKWRFEPAKTNVALGHFWI